MITEGDGVTVTGTGSIDTPYVVSADGLPAATPFTTTMMPNPVTAGNMTVVVLAADNPIFASGLAGDAYPRLLISADNDTAFIMFGDGTTDPYSGSAFVGLGNSNDVAIGFYVRVGDYGLRVRNPGDLEVLSSSHGVILHSPDTTAYRVTVNNAGTLVVTAV